MEQYETVSLPNDFLERIFKFIRQNDKLAYTHMSDAELRGHLAFAGASGQILCRISDDQDIQAVATWQTSPRYQAVFLVGIIGDKAFLRHMLTEWHETYPYYKLLYFRKGKPRERHHLKTLTCN